MSRGGLGVGSASIVLVFAVLCLTVFSLITFVVASNERRLVENEAVLVTGFFEADALAESIVAEILMADEIPQEVQGVEVHTQTDFDSGAEIITFSSPIDERIAILVRLAIYYDRYDIISWRLYNTDEWVYDGGLNIWTGPPGEELDDGGFGFGDGNPWETATDPDSE